MLMIPLLLVGGAVVFYETTIYAPNIYGVRNYDAITFSREIFAAALTQLVAYKQDYFLWQTYVLAYGWLDAVAPDGVYFAVKLAWLFSLLLSFLALVWNFRNAFPKFFVPVVFAQVVWVLAMVGGVMEGHTALGRYLLPLWLLFFGLPMVTAASLFSGSRRKNLAPRAVLMVFCAFFGVLSLYGSHVILVKRFLIGGNF